ncbi:S8 family serine peptidase [Pseudomarimonas arenosa]|uniref:S8 family serine peptidase n=1 Tax=Pseudomarimonas arenosa TaxID=2774145 RepID=A0AAW3ZHM4_9GAMM|nr:S8 family serine peptidase [Pseudomarimonas arenosa]MBD8525588.1 S8 family serine peptidase [Pseudomarimonas arenosa]
MSNRISNLGACRSRKPLVGAISIALCAAGLSLGGQAISAEGPVELHKGQVMREPGSRAAKIEAASEYARYTVVLRKAPVAAYRGELPAFAAVPQVTSGRRAGRPEMQSPQAQAYAAFLRQEQDRFLNDASFQLKRSLPALGQMQHAINGVIVELTEDEAARLRKLDDVLFVERDRQLDLLTDRGPTFIGAPSLWDGSANDGAGSQGEGVVVAVLDSGINWESPAFAATGPLDSYVHVNPLGAGNYLGLCGPTAPNADLGRCNDKLIGMFNFASTSPTRSGADDDGHGSHTASTVAGNQRDVNFGGANLTLSGVAPHATVISYKVCIGTCPSSAITQATDDAVSQGIVDLISFSISGGDSPWNQANALGFLNASDAGILVVAAAGNDGPAAGTSDHQEPWVQTVAASTHDRGAIAFEFDLTAPGTPPGNTVDLPVTPGAAPIQSADIVGAPLIVSPTFADGSNDGCSAFAANTFTRAAVPAIAVLQLDGTASNCASSARKANATAAGALGVIFVDQGFLNLGASGNAWSMRMSDWTNVAAAISGDPSTAAASILTPLKAFPSTATPDRIADFSGRGPRPINGQFLVKPDIAAPGVDIIAASLGPGDTTEMLNGTSMATPHVTGSAALIRALQPSWTPMEVKSALMMTAKTTDLLDHNDDPSTPWDRGSGRVDLTVAAKSSLVLNETTTNFSDADPGNGGDISTLNLPSMANGNCVGSCEFTRSVERVRTGSATYNLAISGLPMGAASVNPTNFMLSESGTTSFTVTVDGTMLPAGTWQHGELTLSSSVVGEPDLHMPISVQAAGPSIAFDPTSLEAATATTTTANLDLSNVGNPTLNWSVVTGTQSVNLLNQGPQLGNGFRGSEHPASPTSTGFASDDFLMPAEGTLTRLQSNGFVLGANDLSSATSITFQVYGDDNGKPNGAPGFGTAPLFTFTAAPNAPGVDIAADGIVGDIALDLATAGATSPTLPSGRYWLLVYPSYATSTGSGATGNPLWAAAITGVGAPTNGFAPRSFAPASATPAWVIPTLSGAPGPGPAEAFSMGADGQVTCGASWLSVTSATSGSLGLAGSTTVNVQFDASGLSPGEHFAALCFSSNDAERPIAYLPVRFGVPFPDTNPTLAVDAAPSSLSAFSTSTVTLQLGNPGASVATLTSDLVTALPSGVRVAPSPNASTTCGGTLTATALSNSVTLSSGAQIPFVGSCSVQFDVQPTAEGNYQLNFGVGDLQTDSGSNQSIASASLTVSAPVFPAPYCNVGFPSGVEPISLVQFAGINNASSAAINGTPALQDFTSISGAVGPGLSYTMTVKGNTDGNFTDRVRAYIDWNNDGIFNDDASERYIIGDITNSTGEDAVSASAVITVPALTPLGSVRMRVLKRYSTQPTPCNTAGYGQAEDYTINVIPRVFSDGFEGTTTR